MNKIEKATAEVEAMPTAVERVSRKGSIFFDADLDFFPCQKDHCYEPRYEDEFTSLCKEHHWELEDKIEAMRQEFVFGED
jgi:hypothetical protein